MSMTKAEKAAVEGMKRDLAFRWPMAPEPQPMPVPALGQTNEGWIFNEANTHVERAWSEASRHGRYFSGDRMSASQRGIPLYRSEADAYTALRWAMCRTFAGKLRNVDKRTPTPQEPPHAG